MPIATARRVYRLAYRDDQAAIVVVAAILAATLVAYLWVTAAVRSLAAAAFGGDALGELVGPALVALAATTTVAVLSIAELAALNQVVQVRATARLQPWLLDHVLRWPLGEHDHRSPGDLRDVIVNLTASATASVAALVKPAIALVQTLFVLVVMLTVDILLASVVIGTLALYTAFFVAIQRPLGKLQEQVTAAERAVSGRVDDVHRNADEIKRSALEDPLLDDFAATAEPWFVANRRYFRRINTLGFGGDLLALLLPAALLLAGSASGRTSEPATLVTVYLLALLLVGLFRSVQIASRASFAGADHWRVVFGLFDTPAEPTGGTPVTGSDIEWSGVTKTWRDRQVLDGVDLTIGHGEKCALVGRSGHGKTTALRMLVGLTNPDGGTVRVGGVDVTTAEPASLRSRVAVVTQDPYLFDATVAGNLDPSGGADPAEIAELLDVVGLGDAVAALPDGLETRTGAGGHDLSGGERARVALARALGRRPEILILDETFANLDSQTEERIVARLVGLPCTIVAVTHRLASLTQFDRVIGVDAGAIAFDGPTTEVVGSAAFRRLFELDETGDGSADNQREGVLR